MKKLLYIFIISVIAVLFLNKVVFKETPEKEKQERLEDVWRYTHPITSISMDHANNSDLKIFDSILKDNRVLILGENVHSDGATMQAKGRMIQYLHENLGYNMVLYEAGQYDTWIMNEEMKNHSLKVHPDSIGGLGLFDFWWDNKETRPLINYYQKTKTSAQPIELGGFDIQFTGNVLYDRRNNLLKEFLSKNKIDLKPFKVFSKYMNQLNHFMFEGFARRTLEGKQKEQLFNEMNQLEKAIAKLEKTPENRMYGRYLHDMRNYLYKISKYKSGTLSSMQFRDSLMAQNLIHQIDSVYQDQKVIVWCSNIHSFAYQESKDYRPIGAYIKSKYGKASYMIDFSSYALFNDKGKVIEKPGKLAIENIFHALKTPYFFIDLRAVPNTSILKKEFTSTINQRTDQKKVWSRFFDGIFYIDINTSLTPIK
ncbi:erythromycin esterase family protein [Chryseobacterium sp.]|uniref:erythromycin esterase family protein n=1 Tax=Chryseobacterium sp. TaxID=1871047 RepID=UPI00289FBFB8|nr:erythromycin esterase family protein [Chryseobacterium sp.]